jgi:hypothetical protein
MVLNLSMIAMDQASGLSLSTNCRSICGVTPARPSSVMSSGKILPDFLRASLDNRPIALHALLSQQLR